MGRLPNSGLTNEDSTVDFDTRTAGRFNARPRTRNTTSRLLAKNIPNSDSRSESKSAIPNFPEAFIHRNDHSWDLISTTGRWSGWFLSSKLLACVTWERLNALFISFFICPIFPNVLPYLFFMFLTSFQCLHCCSVDSNVCACEACCVCVMYEQLLHHPRSA